MTRITASDPNQLKAGAPVIIVGGSSGIGLASAHRFARNGNKISIVGRDPERLETALQLLRNRHAGIEFEAFSADATDADQINRAFRESAEKLGHPGGLVFSAGESAPGYWENMSIADDREIMEVNYFGVLNCIRAFDPWLKEGSAIALVSSSIALHGVCGYGAYAPSKFALRGLAEVLRGEMKARKVSVTLCLPPDTDTPQLARERPARPVATATFSSLGGTLSPEAVAKNLFKAVMRRRFLAIPSFSLRLLYLFSGFVAPILRWYQVQLIRRERDD